MGGQQAVTQPRLSQNDDSTTSLVSRFLLELMTLTGTGAVAAGERWVTALGLVLFSSCVFPQISWWCLENPLLLLTSRYMAILLGDIPQKDYSETSCQDVKFHTH